LANIFFLGKFHPFGNHLIAGIFGRLPPNRNTPKPFGDDMKKIRTLMVDDSPEFLQAAARFLCIDPEIEIVAQVQQGSDVLAAVLEHQPDVILLDLAMPDFHGLEVIQQIKEQITEPPYIVVLTLYDYPEYRTQSTILGADGFIYKSDFGVELLPTIHQLVDNDAHHIPGADKEAE
jgi:DNA-binding NarL/FixJ family response regulator